MTTPNKAPKWNHVCSDTGKRAYPTRKAAKQAARQLKARIDGHTGHLNAYPCGDHFHLGHLPSWVANGSVSRDVLPGVVVMPPEQRAEWAALVEHIDPEGPWGPLREALPALLAENAELRAALEAAERDADHLQERWDLENTRALHAENLLRHIQPREQRLHDGVTSLLADLAKAEPQHFSIGLMCVRLRALLDPTEPVDSDLAYSDYRDCVQPTERPETLDAPEPDRSSPCTDEDGNPTSWAPPTLRSIE